MDGDKYLAEATDLSISFDIKVIAKTGYIYVKKYDTDELVQQIPAFSPNVVGSGTVNLSIDIGDLEPNEHYYVEIDALAFSTIPGEYYPGTADKDEWDFWTHTSDDSSLKLWLDATDSYSLALSGDRVTQWMDKSGNENDVVQSNNSLRPVSGQETIGGINSVDFSPNSGLIKTDGLMDQTDEMTIFIVYKDDNSQFSRGLFVSNNFRLNTQTIQTLTPSATTTNFIPYATPMLRTFVIEGGQLKHYLNGTLVGTSSHDTPSDSFDQFALGVNSYLNYNGGFDGQIGEIKIYNTALSDSARQNLETSLIDKWLGEPTELEDLILWLDASDENTITLTPFDKVDQWTDKSDQGNHALKETGISAPKPLSSFNSLTALKFQEDDSLKVDLELDGESKTVIMVSKPKLKDNSLQRVMFSPVAKNHHSYRINDKDYIYGDGYSFSASEDLNIQTLIFTANDTVRIYKDGQFMEEETTSFTSTDSYFTIGHEDKGYSGDMAEIIVYDREITSTEQLKIESYLKTKWGIDTGPELLTPTDPDLVSTNLPLTIDFTLDFDRDIVAAISNGAFLIKKADDDSIAYSSQNGDISINGSQLTISSVSLDPSEYYYVSIPEGAFESTNGASYLGISDPNFWTLHTAPFDPNGVELWLDASSSSNFTTNANTRVSQWHDSSEQDRDVTMNNTNYQPNIITDDEGRQLVRFNRDYLNVDGSFTSDNIFVVFKFFDREYAIDRSFPFSSRANNFHSFVQYSKSIANDIYAPSVLIQDRETKGLDNLVDLGDLTILFSKTADPSLSRQYFVGRNYNSFAYVDIAELIVFNRDLSILEREAIFDYLEDKWSINAPKVTSTSPIDDEAEIPTNLSQLVLNFDRDISSGNGQINIYDSDAGTLAQSYSTADLSITGNQASLNLSSNLDPDTNYYVTIDNGVFLDNHSYANNKYSQDKSFFNFRTTDNDPSFSVNDLNGIELWYDASLTNTVTESGGRVSEVQDISGNNRSGLQSNNNYKPNYGAVQQNSLEMLDIDEDFMSINDGVFKARDVFAVMKAPESLFSATGAVIGTGTSMERIYSFQYRNNSFNDTARADSFYKDGQSITDSDTLSPLDQAMLFEVVHGDDVKETLYRFSNQEGGRPRLHVGELIVFDHELSSTERLNLTNHLIDKWGIEPVQLISSSPTDNQIGVAEDTRISLEFDRDVFVGTGNMEIRRTADDTIFETIDLANTSIAYLNSTEISIPISSDLEADTEYYVLIDSGAIYDSSGYIYRGITDKNALNFSTEAIDENNFIPSYLNGLELWLDGQDQDTLNLSGSIVQNWNDKSGNDHHTNAVTNLNVEFGTRQHRNLDLLTFTSDYMTLDNNNFKSKNVFYVYRSHEYRFTGTGAVLGAQNNSERFALLRGGTNMYHPDPYPTELIHNNLPVASNSQLGTIKDLMIDMIEPYSSDSTRSYYLGAGETHRNNIDIGEVIVYNQDLSDENREKVFRYLHNKWKVSGPVITSLSPTDNSTINGVISQVTAKFDRNIEFINNGNIFVKNSLDDTIIETIPVGSPNISQVMNGFTLTLSDALSNNGSYYIQIMNGTLESVNGLPFYELENKDTWSFHIEDAGESVESNLELWLDASDSSTISKSGGYVNQWLDKSSNKRVLTQSGSDRPQIGGITQNNMDIMVFNASYMDIDKPRMTAREIIQVMRNPSTIYQSRSAILGSENANEKAYEFAENTTLLRSTPSLTTVYRNLDEVTDRDLGPIQFFTINFLIPATYNESFEYNVGLSGTNKLHTQLAELMVFDKVLSDEERTNLMIELAEKWDVDIYAPVPTSFSPADEATDVPRDTDLSITFDEVVYANYGYINVYRRNDGILLERVDVNSSQVTGWGTDTINIDLTHKLTANSEIYINVDNRAITDIFFNRTAEIGSDDEEWDFNTVRTNEDIFFRWKMF